MDDNEGSVNLIPDVSSGLLQAKPAKNIPLAKAKPSKSESLRTSVKKLCALCGKKNKSFLLLAIGSEKQCYVSFGMPLS